ncbi:MAG TPA: acyltransferase [Rudaea sp.]|nr:acyltransferase [Rudaea sp.]
MNHDRRIAFLDYLRVFAFVSVFLGHKYFTALSAFASDPSGWYPARLVCAFVLPFLHRGGAGVVVFFLVSGYVIAHVLGKETAGEFVVKRFFRIYPLFVGTVLLEYTLLGWFPDGTDLLRQLLLVGDFFGTRYALAGVDWTLRIEVVFYAFMAMLRAFDMFGARRNALPIALIAALVGCGLLAPIPATEIWSKGYLTIYAPFLLLGSMAYLFERREIPARVLIAFGALVFVQYYALMLEYQPDLARDTYVFVGCAVFFAAFAARDALRARSGVFLLSELTYAVYLFHNWFFDYMETAYAGRGLAAPFVDLIVCAALFAVCILATVCIEKPFIRLGRRVVKAWSTRRLEPLGASDAGA